MPSKPTKKRPWTAEEDALLLQATERHGLRKWAAIAAELGRPNEAVRLRWQNVLNPATKKAPFSEWEQAVIVLAQPHYNNQWSSIASLLPGRTPYAVKNHWYNTLSRKVSKDLVNNSYVRPGTSLEEVLAVAPAPDGASHAAEGGGAAAPLLALHTAAQRRPSTLAAAALDAADAADALHSPGPCRPRSSRRRHARLSALKLEAMLAEETSDEEGHEGEEDGEGEDNNPSEHTEPLSNHPSPEAAACASAASPLRSTVAAASAAPAARRSAAASASSGSSTLQSACVAVRDAMEDVESCGGGGGGLDAAAAPRPATPSAAIPLAGHWRLAPRVSTSLPCHIPGRGGGGGGDCGAGSGLLASESASPWELPPLRAMSSPGVVGALEESASAYSCPPPRGGVGACSDSSLHYGCDGDAAAAAAAGWGREADALAGVADAAAWGCWGPGRACGDAAPGAAAAWPAPQRFGCDDSPFSMGGCAALDAVMRDEPMPLPPMAGMLPLHEEAPLSAPAAHLHAMSAPTARPRSPCGRVQQSPPAPPLAPRAFFGDELPFGPPPRRAVLRARPRNVYKPDSSSLQAFGMLPPSLAPALSLAPVPPSPPPPALAPLAAFREDLASVPPLGMLSEWGTAGSLLDCTDDHFLPDMFDSSPHSLPYPDWSM